MTTARGLFGSACLLLLAACSEEAPELGQERSGSDEAEITEAMIAAIKEITLDRREGGIVPRLNQAKGLGCLAARFEVHDALDEGLAQGVFQPGRRYDALVRFANASTDDDREPDFRGMSIKLLGVEGDPLWGEPGEQHFLLNSHPALFAEDPAEFLAFLEATAEDARWKFFVNPAHWDALWTIVRGREEIANPLAIRYWSTVPFRHGPDRSVAVKYTARPCASSVLREAEPTHPDFLRDSMAASLAAGPACFDFLVQRQTDAVAMPMEDASVPWDEQVSPPVSVATLTMEEQDFRSPAALLACEQQTFSPWQSLPAHRPLGGINRVRRAVYSEAADFRLEQSTYRPDSDR